MRPGGGPERLGDSSGPGPPKKEEKRELLPSELAAVAASGAGPLDLGLTKEKKLSTSLPFGASGSEGVSTSPYCLRSLSRIRCFQRSKSSTVDPISICKSDPPGLSHSGAPSSGFSPNNCEIFSADILSSSELLANPVGLRSHLPEESPCWFWFWFLRSLLLPAPFFSFVVFGGLVGLITQKALSGSTDVSKLAISGSDRNVSNSSIEYMYALDDGSGLKSSIDERRGDASRVDDLAVSGSGVSSFAALAIALSSNFDKALPGSSEPEVEVAPLEALAPLELSEFS